MPIKRICCILGLCLREGIAFAFGGIAFAGFTIGCQSQPGSPDLPRYSEVTAPAALQVLAARAASIHAMTARCDLTMIRGDHQSIQLDGLMVMSPPDRLRLRVWKLDQAVFDLTVLPAGFWVETSPEAASHGAVAPQALSAAQLAHYLSWFEGGFFSAPGLTTQATLPDTLIFSRTQSDGATILCDVDRASLTPREFRLLDNTGTTRFSLAMSDYREISGIIWPTRLSAVSEGKASATGDSTSSDGEIDILFHDIEFNGDLASGAFVPPPNAEKRP